MSGSTSNAASSGSGSSATIAMAVNPSVSQTVGMAPMRAPMKAHTSLPTAPPAKTSVSASPTVGTLAPLAVSRNGRNNRNPMRVALSSMPIVSSTGKAKRGRAPCAPPAMVGLGSFDTMSAP